MHQVEGGLGVGAVSGGDVPLHHLWPLLQPADSPNSQATLGPWGLTLSLLLAAGNANVNWEHCFLGSQGSKGRRRHLTAGQQAVRRCLLLFRLVCGGRRLGCRGAVGEWGNLPLLLIQQLPSSPPQGLPKFPLSRGCAEQGNQQVEGTAPGFPV